MSGLIEFLKYRALRDDLRAGKPDAVDALFATLGVSLYQYALSITRRREDAEEALQDVFMQLVRDTDRLRQVRDLKGYLYRAVRNRAFNQGRQRSREVALEPSLFDRAEPTAMDVDELEPALHALPDEQREIVVLKIWQGLTFREIAALLDIPANTAASRYRYALQHMKRHLTEEAYATV